ncbi:nocturnin [Trichonephila inaurata madagascariensis]|uniref:Nocturnin n=1 Tax=Trichonephila inaurata madagascariensis TaxID=2747483 RepID=A0A8X7CT07_9ARAC|nr:nocturnin [Trichonephila inaurata madagascariensis]
MGSFTSAPKILNDDTADNDLLLPPNLTWEDLKVRCEEELTTLPPKISRSFHKVKYSAKSESKIDDPKIRVMQWNILSQGNLERQSLSIFDARKKDKTIFWVATTHLKARQGPLLATMRREQGRDLLDFIKAHSGNNPVIVTGDFNANPSEPMYHALTKEDIFPLDSAYRYLNNKKTEPPYTTWKTGEYCHSRFFF